MTRKIVSKYKMRNGAQPFSSHDHEELKMELWPKSWRSAARWLHSCIHGELKRELCHHLNHLMMETSHSSILFYKVWRGAQPSFPRSWRARERALPSSWRSAARWFFYSHAHGESKSELCHHHGISQKNPFDLIIYLFACVWSLYI